VPRGSEPINPFYVLLIVVGIAFTLTSSAYGVMMFKATQPLGRVDLGVPDGLLGFMQTYGGWLLGGELLALAVATVGAIAVDDRRIKRRERDKM
jgi:hypothetical protein